MTPSSDLEDSLYAVPGFFGAIAFATWCVVDAIQGDAGALTIIAHAAVGIVVGGICGASIGAPLSIFLSSAIDKEKYDNTRRKSETYSGCGCRCNCSSKKEDDYDCGCGRCR